MKSALKAGLSALVVGVIVVVGAAVYFMQDDRSSMPTVTQTGQSGKALIGGPFELVDGSGRTVTDKDFRGKYLLVFFGFTHCPDVCPTALSEIALTLDALGEVADKVQPLFISVDPERDTPELMGEYVAQFHPRIMGLTGSPDQVADVAKAYRVYYKKSIPEEEIGKEDPFYVMDHSAITYLMSPDGDFLKHFSHGTAPDEMAAAIRDVVQ